jgi:hypothetical protein
MTGNAIQQPFSNLQLELLKLYSKNVSENDLLQIKLFLAQYFAEKAMDEADRIWEEKDYTAEKILNTHRRTPYPKKNK